MQAIQEHTVCHFGLYNYHYLVPDGPKNKRPQTCAYVWIVKQGYLIPPPEGFEPRKW